MLTRLFNNITNTQKQEAIEQLIANSSPRPEFFLMTGLAVIMASYGLLLNSAAIIIGSMLIAPLLYPLLSLALGVVIADTKLIARSTGTLLKSVGISIGIAIVVSLLLSSYDFSRNTEILSRIDPSLDYFFVALIAGMAASFSMVKPGLNERLPGVAISVALIPPVAVIGLGIAALDWFVIKQSLILLLINVIGVILASVMTFSLMDLYIQRRMVKEAIKKDEKDIKAEEKKAEDKKQAEA